jgi:EAL domain-containing protein (putative c-di-GMP-specific phosphodiesterase class I)
VLETACAAAAAWPEPLTISVNLSSAQFRDGGLPKVVSGALARAGLAPHRLQLEITESLLLEQSESVMAQLRALKQIGVAIVMDDFGTGFSSLNYLWRFPFDKIKIDASFMTGVAAGDLTASKVVHAIVTLGHALGMRVCIEGVETRKQAAFAAALACDEVQGFYFARPQPLGDLPATLLADFRRRTGAKSPPAPADRSRDAAI